MPTKYGDLHGNAPDKSHVALLIIDGINDLEFESGSRLLPPALAMAKKLAALKARAAKESVPVIFMPMTILVNGGPIFQPRCAIA